VGAVIQSSVTDHDACRGVGRIDPATGEVATRLYGERRRVRKVLGRHGGSGEESGRGSGSPHRRWRPVLRLGVRWCSGAPVGFGAADQPAKAPLKGVALACKPRARRRGWLRVAQQNPIRRSRRQMEITHRQKRAAVANETRVP
jgi:hypothetical protein